jgi:hypothetical protein
MKIDHRRISHPHQTDRPLHINKTDIFCRQDLHLSIHRKRRPIIVHTNNMDNYGNDLLTSAFIHSILIILDENLPPNNTSTQIVKENVRFAKVKEINNEYNIPNTFSYIKIVTEDQTIEANRRRLIKYHATR